MRREDELSRKEYWYFSLIIGSAFLLNFTIIGLVGFFAGRWMGWW